MVSEPERDRAAARQGDHEVVDEESTFSIIKYLKMTPHPSAFGCHLLPLEKAFLPHVLCVAYKVCVILSGDLVRETKQVGVEPAKRAAPERRDPLMAANVWCTVITFAVIVCSGRPQVSPTGLWESGCFVRNRGGVNQPRQIVKPSATLFSKNHLETKNQGIYEDGC